MSFKAADGWRPAEPPTTGLYVQDWGDAIGAHARYEVRFAFAGERWFDDESLAQAAMLEYEAIVTARPRKEVERLQGILSGDATLLHMSYSEGNPLQVALRHPLVLAQVAAVRGVLDSCNAENYVEVIFNDPDHDPPQQYVVTYQRASGKTPHELRRLAEQERDVAREQAERWEREVRTHHQRVVEAIAKAYDDRPVPVIVRDALKAVVQ